ncbi:MAG: OmpH family outer membrane protein [Tannerella sp.]|jgi:outer membrane protein|nr:OmpH family outer membrane protein [Tannerella sp.]
MKNVNYLISGVLAVAVIILFVMQCSDNKTEQNTVGNKFANFGDSVSSLPVAYFYIDTLLQNYNFAKDLNEQITRKQENARANLTQQARNLESEINEFRYKAQNGAFLTQARAEQEQERLMKKQQDLQNMDAKLTQELIDETNRMNEQLRDTIMSHLRIFNQDKKYQIIISSDATNPIFLADEVYNITGEIVDYLNRRWSGNPGN